MVYRPVMLKPPLAQLYKLMDLLVVVNMAYKPVVSLPHLIMAQLYKLMATSQVMT